MNKFLQTKNIIDETSLMHDDEVQVFDIIRGVYASWQTEVLRRLASLQKLCSYLLVSIVRKMLSDTLPASR